jgi:hypothetical protein
MTVEVCLPLWGKYLTRSAWKSAQQMIGISTPQSTRIKQLAISTPTIATMNLPVSLQKEAEKWAQFQGVSLEEFILQAVAEKVSGLNHQMSETQMPETLERLSQDIHSSMPELPRLDQKEGILVIKTAPFNLDINAFIDEMREERIREQMVW